jgi:hypothetical protein
MGAGNKNSGRTTKPSRWEAGCICRREESKWKTRPPRILLLREDLKPGEDHGRPLIPLGPSLWRIHDGYPEPPATLVSTLTELLPTVAKPSAP